jgi:hypothetical protein
MEILNSSAELFRSACHCQTLGLPERYLKQ